MMRHQIAPGGIGRASCISTHSGCWSRSGIFASDYGGHYGCDNWGTNRQDTQIQLINQD